MRRRARRRRTGDARRPAHSAPLHEFPRGLPASGHSFLADCRETGAAFGRHSTAGLAGLLLVASLLLGGCGSAWERDDAPPPGDPTPPPTWVEHGVHPEYQAPRYIVALGASNVSPRQAHQRAQTQARQMLREEVRDAVAHHLGAVEAAANANANANANKNTNKERSGAENGDAAPGHLSDEPATVATGDGEAANETSAEHSASSAHATPNTAEEAASLDAVEGVTELLLATLVPSEADERLRDRVPVSPRIAPFELSRKAYYSDGFTFYALWGVDRQRLVEWEQPRPSNLRAVDAHDPEHLAQLIGQAAGEVATWMAQHPPADDNTSVVRSSTALGDGDAPGIVRLAELWAQAALATASIAFDGEHTVRVQRLEPRTVEVELGLHTLDETATAAGLPSDARFFPEVAVATETALEDAPLTLYAVGMGCPANVRITDHGPSLVSELPVRHLDRELPSEEAVLGHGASHASDGLALTPPSAPRTVRLQITLEAQPSLADRGTVWLVADRLPEGFAPWRHLFPVATHRLDFVLPRMERLHWRSEVRAVLDGVEMSEDALSPLMSALLIESGHDELAAREYRPEVHEPLRPEDYLVVLRGHMEVRYDEESKRPLATGELRLIAEDARDAVGDGNTELELTAIELVGRGFPNDDEPFPALRDALSRSRVQFSLRQALDRFTR